MYMYVCVCVYVCVYRERERERERRAAEDNMSRTQDKGGKEREVGGGERASLLQIL